jgi:hypothetical protein
VKNYKNISGKFNSCRNKKKFKYEKGAKFLNNFKIRAIHNECRCYKIREFHYVLYFDYLKQGTEISVNEEYSPLNINVMLAL